MRDNKIETRRKNTRKEDIRKLRLLPAIPKLKILMLSLVKAPLLKGKKSWLKAKCQ
jgi:hypothetical protein